MNYRLSILTHGDSAPLAETLRSFFNMVTPAPTEVAVIADAPSSVAAIEAIRAGVPERRLSPVVAVGGIGCCRANAICWTANRASICDYVFHLEHDFRFLRKVDLRDLAAVLVKNPQLAQMALVRQPVGAEPDPGGYIAGAPGWYHRRSADRIGKVHDDTETFYWFEHRRNFTLNPSLIPYDFVAQHEWPEGDGCEHVFSADVLAREEETTFGLWGEGEVWVEHFGKHDGHGY